MAIKQFNLKGTQMTFYTLYLIGAVLRETQPISAFKNRIAIDPTLTAPTMLFTAFCKNRLFFPAFCFGNTQFDFESLTHNIPCLRISVLSAKSLYQALNS
jgi:hypothetical protein